MLWLIAVWRLHWNGIVTSHLHKSENVSPPPSQTSAMHPQNIRIPAGNNNFPPLIFSKCRHEIRTSRCSLCNSLSVKKKYHHIYQGRTMISWSNHCSCVVPRSNVYLSKNGHRYEGPANAASPRAFIRFTSQISYNLIYSQSTYISGQTPVLMELYLEEARGV